jgi:predicted methyltransferase MtxX (methanogen marker protein 4)
MSRLTIDITEQQHQRIKALAALQGKSIKEYAIERLFASTPDEEQAMAELKTLLAPRIAGALRGDVSSKSVDEIVEDVIRSGGTV